MHFSDCSQDEHVLGADLLLGVHSWWWSSFHATLVVILSLSISLPLAICCPCSLSKLVCLSVLVFQLLIPVFLWFLTGQARGWLMKILDKLPARPRHYGHWPLRPPSSAELRALTCTTGSSKDPFISPGGLMWADLPRNGWKWPGCPSVTPL